MDKRVDLPIVGHFFVNKTKDGRHQIKAKFPDGTVLFLNFKKDSKDQGIISLGTGGKPYELKGADVKVTIDVRLKDVVDAPKKGGYARKTDTDDSPF
jgi:hypothetical protein